MFHPVGSRGSSVGGISAMVMLMFVLVFVVAGTVEIVVWMKHGRVIRGRRST